jgi:oligosaccharide translocation protein RFT1
MHAVATESQLKRSNDSLLVFSVISVVLNVVLIKISGSVGLIMANSLSILSAFWLPVQCAAILTVVYFMLFTVFLPYGNHVDAETETFVIFFNRVFK